ncbi:MAG: hypothetical protein ABWZ99_06820 [Ilumatobacteraceae bacterium]
MSADDGGSLTEAAAVGVFGGLLGSAVGWPLGLAVPLGVVAAANGVASGWRRVYDWRSAKGVTAVVLDSTWALPMTAAALFANVVGAVTHGGYVDDLSRRANRHVYQRGFMPRKGFALTLGNVISGAADTSRPRRRRLITDHEDVHVWQARWLGPLYPVAYVGWMFGAGAVGSIAWLTRHRDKPLTKVVETYGYYLNPLEWWAYSRDDHWPPGGKLGGIGWKHPAVRSFNSIRGDRGAPTAPR